MEMSDLMKEPTRCFVDVVVPHVHTLPGTISPIMSFDTAIDGEPMSSVAFCCSQIKPRGDRTLHCLSTGEKGFGYEGPRSPELFQDSSPSCNFPYHNSIGVKTSCGETFDDENFILNHTGPGMPSLANAEPNAKGP